MRVLVKAGTVLYQRPGAVKLTVLKADTQFTVVNTIKDWTEIDYQAGSWVLTSATVYTPEPIPDPIPVPIPNPDPVIVPGVLVVAGTVLYQRPGEVKLYKLTNDMFFEVITDSGDWLKVNYRTSGAWVAKSATRVITNPAPPASPSQPNLPSQSPSEEEPVPNISVPPKPVEGGMLLYSMPDYVSRNGKNHPATRSPYTTKFFKMNSKWTAYQLALNKLLHPDMDNKEFMDGFMAIYNGARAFDNGHGFQTGDWRIANIYCAGATFKLVNNGIKKADSRIWMRAKAIPYNSVPPIPTKLSDIDMTLHFFPTTATATGNNPFPQLGGRFLVPFIAAEWDLLNGFFNWVDITGYPDRPGGMIRVDKVGHPFVSPRWDITAGLIDLS